MRYKVGDKVRVRSDLEEDKQYGCQVSVDDMQEFIGRETIIQSVSGRGYCLMEDDGMWFWTDEMLEDVAGRETGPTYDTLHSMLERVERRIGELEARLESPAPDDTPAREAKTLRAKGYSLSKIGWYKHDGVPLPANFPVDVVEPMNYSDVGSVLSDANTVTETLGKLVELGLVKPE